MTSGAMSTWRPPSRSSSRRLDRPARRRAERFEQRLVAFDRQTRQQMIEAGEIDAIAGEDAFEVLGTSEPGEESFRRRPAHLRAARRSVRAARSTDRH